MISNAILSNLFRAGTSVTMFPPCSMPIPFVQRPAVLSNPQIPFALPRSRKRLESPGAAPGPGPPLHGMVFLCRSRWASFFVP